MAGRNMSLVSREVLSRGIFGAFAVSLTLGAVQLASGRDLSGVSQGLMASSEAGINRAAKSDRSRRVHGSAGQTHTISFRLDGLSDMSVLVRVARSNSSAPSLITPGDRRVACESVVSVLTEVAKQLEPGRCVT
jgi:hypothetical protein